MRRQVGLIGVFLMTVATATADDKTEFGKMPDGTAVQQYTLKNRNGMNVKIITLGGIISELHVPDKDGKFDDVVLGFHNLDGYLQGHPYFGCITGRYCNRIAKGKFTLDGKEYTLAVNNKPNHLHGGVKGFDKVVWKAAPLQLEAGQGHGIVLTYRSVDGEEGYPGNLNVTVRYILLDDNTLVMQYEAKTDKPTVINLTNHSYFNLAGIRGGDVLGHELEINADQITPTDDTFIPTGKIVNVKDTPFDFTAAKAIGKDIGQIKGDPGGYDLNYVVGGSTGDLRHAASVHEPKTGRTMDVFTKEPGVQFYSGNFLDGKVIGKGGVAYKKHFGFCLETQHYPDSPNQPNFPSVVLTPGSNYSTSTIYRFGVKR